MAIEKTNGKFDVIVVGGGPSGSMTAYWLAKAGVRVLLLDAKRFPRDKPCGGGVQEKAARRIPFDWQAVKRGTLHGISFSQAFSDKFRRTYPQPLVHSVLRTEFDEFLLRAAQQAGAKVLEGVTVTRVLDEGAKGIVEAGRDYFAARIVVGADGANGVSKQSLNVRSDYYWQSGLYCEVPEQYLVRDAIDYDCMRVDWGTLPSGYAWIFPKAGFANVGVGFPNTIGRSARPYLSRFLETEGVLKPGSAPALTFKGHQLPTLTGTTKLSKGTILLVGDAAGLIEPFTGDGISCALHSAEVAAEVIRQNLERPRLELVEYEQRVRAEMGCEIMWSRKLLSFFVTFPNMIHEVFKRDDKVWASFCRVLRGEESFRVFRRRKFGIFEFLWAPVDVFTGRYERRRVRDLENDRNSFMRNVGQMMDAVVKRI